LALLLRSWGDKVKIFARATSRLPPTPKSFRGTGNFPSPPRAHRAGLDRGGLFSTSGSDTVPDGTAPPAVCSCGRDAPHPGEGGCLPGSTPEDERGDRGTHPSARTICTWVSPLVQKSIIWSDTKRIKKFWVREKEGQNRIKSNRKLLDGGRSDVIKAAQKNRGRVRGAPK